jgi:predicted Rossmann fold flavoprotein
MTNTTQKEQYDVVILGGGAAGLMCALTAGQRGRRVLVIEKTDKVGKKILISGGGRCNFTNINASYKNYLSSNPHFCRSALSRYSPQDFIELVEKHDISYHEKTLGQLFCDDSARQIVDMLLKECTNTGVTIRTNTVFTKVASNDNDPFPYVVFLTDGREISCQSLVIATGGPSIPKMGASGIGYELAKQFGHTIITPLPALVPLTFSPDEFAPFTALSGVSLSAMVSCNGGSFRENILFTHRGLSGPAILQISSYWKEGDSITLDLLPDVDLRSEFTRLHKQKTEMKNVLTAWFPKRFSETWCSSVIESKPIAHFVHKELDYAADSLKSWSLTPDGTEGFAKAEVTIGGVNTNELSSKTMESNLSKGLYFIGEVVDVTGWLGGYNFQWAWASGYASGLVA